MTIAKFQHYVPRFYLARFVDQEGFVWVFDKMNGRTFRLKPETIAGQNRFYHLDELEQYGGGTQSHGTAICRYRIGSTKNISEYSGVESLTLTLPMFHESFFLTPGFFHENEEISARPPISLTIGDC